MKRLFTSIILISIVMLAQALTSPNKKITAVITPDGIQIGYNSGKECIPILKIFSGGLTQKGEATPGQVDYTMVTGKRSHCTNSYTEAVFISENGEEIPIRLYNDGATWKASNHQTIYVSSTHDWLMKWRDSYEDFFPRDRQTKPGDRWGFPSLFEYSDDVFMLLTESGIDRDCAAASLYSASTPQFFDINTEGPGETCWTTAIIGSLADVVESTLVTDNSAPSRLTDTSWIEPGVASWVYWAYNHGSKEPAIIRRYIDMAAAMKLPYVVIDAEWDEMTDPSALTELLAYARSLGVKPMIWYNSTTGWIDGAPGPKWRLNKPEDREKEFAWCADNGIAGLKIDFFGGDSNENISYMVDLLESAARHHLAVNFHGATIPRGWQRTYPNLMSTEGVYGAEWYNNKPVFTNKAAAHNATLPFTRNVVGSMDYTPCAWTDSQYPHITSDAHELALTALFESGVQHLADRPESFLSQPEEIRDFITGLPTAWDETLLVGGYPADYVVLARRKGHRWYIAGVNGTDTQRTIPLDLSRLQLPSMAKVVTYEDGTGGWLMTHPLEAPTKMTMKPRGGFIITADI